MRITAYICLLIFFGAPALSFGEQPIEALKRGIDKGIRVLEDPIYHDASRKKKQLQRLWEITREIFDFKEFSRRVLASHWQKFTPQQQNDFIEAFGDFLGKFYLRRLQAIYNGEKVAYLDEEIIGKSKALVEIKVLWLNLEVPVRLRMTKRSGVWKVYDLSALGISAVANYRAQFNWILQKRSPEQVIELLKEKSHNLEKDTL
jgi:phospholipid transport system substrate-binding protein